MLFGLMMTVFALDDRGCHVQTFIIYTLIVGILVVFGIIGNSFTFVVFWKGNFKSSTSFLFMCLALTDSVVLLTAFMIYSIKSVSTYMSGKNFFQSYTIIGLYIFAAFLYVVSHTFTMWMTVLIAVNRYIIVCRPLRASEWCTNSKVKKQVVAVLVLAILYNIAIFGGMVVHRVVAITEPLYIYILDAICTLILPICILALLNIRLIQALNTHRRMQVQNRSIQKDNSTTFVLVIVIVVVIICQVPQVFNFFLQISLSTFTNTCDSLFYLQHISVALVVLNSAVNFIIYIVCNKRFRAVLIEKVFNRNATQQEAIAHEMEGVENGEPVNETRI